MLKPYEEYKYSKSPFLGIIPIEWDEYRLCSVTTLKSIQNNQGENLLSVFLNKGVICYTDTNQKQVHKPSEDQSKYQLVEYGNIVLNNQQAWRGSVGVSKYRGIVSPAYYVFSLPSTLNPIFMNYLVRDKGVVDQFVLSSKGVGSIQRTLYYPYLKNVILLIPPRDEQDQIVRYLDWKIAKINKLINAKKKQIELLKEELQHKLYSEDNGDIHILYWDNCFPNTWKMLKARRIFVEKKEKKQIDKELLAVTQDKGVIFKRDCSQKFVVPSDDLSGQKLVVSDDYVISLRSFQGGIETSKIEGIVSPAYSVFSLIDYDYLLHQYYRCLFKSAPFISRLNNLVSDIRDGKKIGFDQFSEILLPMPPIAQLKEVVELINKIDNLKTHETELLQFYNEYRTRLISDVVTGKIDVRNIEVPETYEETEELDIVVDTVDEIQVDKNESEE